MSNPLTPAPAALSRAMDRLALLLDEEVAAARRGDSAALEACWRRKGPLAAEVEAGQTALAAILTAGGADRLEAAPVDPTLRRELAGAGERLKAALARNEAGLRGATEAIRRIFEGAARTLAAEDIGYGPVRLQGEARLFAATTV